MKQCHLGQHIARFGRKNMELGIKRHKLQAQLSSATNQLNDHRQVISTWAPVFSFVKKKICRIPFSINVP